MMNPNAIIVEAASPITIDENEVNMNMICGKRVLCIEDGPRLTHGGMKYGAAMFGALRNGASQIIDPRPFLKGKLKDTFDKYPDIGHLLPAMGYDYQQIKHLQATINDCDCDVIISGTPIHLSTILKVNMIYNVLQNLNYHKLYKIDLRKLKNWTNCCKHIF